MTTEQLDLRTIPVSQESLPNLAKMVKLTKTFASNGQSIVLYAASRATLYAVNTVEPRFFSAPHGKRESVTFHSSGFIVSATDIHASNAPIRRRAAHLLVWGETDERWMTWRVGPVSSIAQGKRLIDKILKTGVLPE